MLGTILSIVLSGFVIGALARLAIPGPDPMPFWLTMLIGLGGSVIGGGLVALIVRPGGTVSPGEYFAITIASIGVAIGLVAAYRRFVQGRPISGLEARRFPTRGIGIARLRQRLQAMGVPVDQIGAPRSASTDTRDERGELSEEEYVERRREILREQA
jgi:uncharacterized membrane protein YeaQ/YmgE (transglycosylase-associated protein family)